MNTILIVDDQEANLYLLKTLLAAHGYAVSEAANGAEALELAGREPPDLIISDILMPVMDGFSLCLAWRNHEKLKHTPFVFYTATYTDPKDEEFALSLGAARFIVKPTETDEFIAMIEQVIAEAESGVMVTERESPQEMVTFYRMYNESLIRKLEDKMLQLEAANHALREDIIERRRAEKEVTRLYAESQRRLKQVEALHSIDLAISGSMDLRMTLTILLKYVEALLNVDAADILLLYPNSHHFKYSAGRGFRTDAVERANIRLDTSFAGRSTLTRSMVVVSENLLRQSDQEFSNAYETEGFLSYVGVPLLAKGQIKGVLEVYHRTLYQPESEWLHLLETLAGQAAIAIDNAQLFNDLQKSNFDLTVAYDATIEGWSRAMALRDKDSQGHAQRVADLTLSLARKMGIGESQMVHMRRGALLHDIGKIGVAEHILLKPGELTDEEQQEIRKHPEFAYDLLSPITHLQPALEIPYCHHEKWDGSGYPRGLKCEEIPIAARIFAVADVCDVIRSDQPYRKAMSWEEALNHIRNESGKYFDPQVVKVFLELLAKPGRT